MRTEGWDARVTIVASGAPRRAGERTDAVVGSIPNEYGARGVHSDAIGYTEAR